MLSDRGEATGDMMPIINSVGLILLTAFLAFMASAFWIWRKSIGAREARIADLETKMAVLTNTVTPLSAAMQAVFIRELTHFHTPELDALLVKVGDGTLPEEDEPRLFSLLEGRAHDLDGRIPESERDVAVMLPMMMRRVKAERLLAAVDIQVVSTSVSSSDTNK